MIFDKAFRPAPEVRNAVTVSGIGLSGGHLESSSLSNSTRLADVSRCIDILSDDMAKLPWFLMNEQTKKRSTTGDPLLHLLRVRPNEAMTPFIFGKALETNILAGGDGFVWIVRDPRSMDPVELIPVPWQLADVHRERDGTIWYSVTNPVNGELMRLPSTDMIHLKCFTGDGLRGVSVLRRARDAITSGIAAQDFQRSFYQNGGQPSGILKTDSDLGGTASVPDGKGGMRSVPKKDLVRSEWERIHSGPNNAHRIAVLDHGLDYKALTISQSDAQFVETRKLSRIDIANFFGIPLYKLNDGKQAYSSNEQNSVDYAVSTLQPQVTQWEQEFSYKLLLDSRLDAGERLRMNMMAALRGDRASRGVWYKYMREIGAFSVNDILSLEDMPPVPGGDTRYASRNYMTLEQFASENGGTSGKN